MKISVLGTGDVGQTLTGKLLDLGHEVMIGTRDVQKKLHGDTKEKSFNEWHSSHSKAKLVTFQESAAFGDLIINATNGAFALNALDLATEETLLGKIIVDVSNPLDSSHGMPPTLLEGLNNTNSLGEEIQKEYPGSKVVKTFNTMWCGLMVNPGLIGKGDHINYISGNDNDAKARVKELIKEFGWRDENLIDLGDITAARATESVLLLWVRLMGALNTGAFNFKIVK